MLYRIVIASAAALMLTLFSGLGTNVANAVAIDCLADGCTVSDNGANIFVDTDEGELTAFSVGGMEHVFEEEFHFCLDGCGGDLNRELSDNFSLSSAMQTGNMITVVFDGDGNGLRLTIDLTLTGGTNTATVNETATLDVIERYGVSLDNIVLSEYDDFDLNDSSGGDTVRYDGTSFIQTDGNTTLVLTSTPFDFFDVEACCESNILSDRLINGHLAGNAGPFGPDDVAFALEYDIDLSQLDSFTISKTKTITIASGEPIPEPSTLAIFGLGLLGLGLRRRRRTR